jgi:hypothetical protein
MATTIEIQEATRKFFEEMINQMIYDYRSLVDTKGKITLTVLQEICIGEKCVSVEIATEDLGKVFRIAGIYESDSEQSAPFIRRLASVLAEGGREVYLDDEQVFSNPVASDIYSLPNIDLKVDESGKNRVLLYSESGQDDWKEFASFSPTATMPSVSIASVLTAERALGLILAAMGKTIRTSCGTRFNGYGVISLLAAINVAQVPIEPQS